MSISTVGSQAQVSHPRQALPTSRSSSVEFRHFVEKALPSGTNAIRPETKVNASAVQARHESSDHAFSGKHSSKQVRIINGIRITIDGTRVSRTIVGAADKSGKMDATSHVDASLKQQDASTKSHTVVENDVSRPMRQSARAEVVVTNIRVVESKVPLRAGESAMRSSGVNQFSETIILGGGLAINGQQGRDADAGGDDSGHQHSQNRRDGKSTGENGNSHSGSDDGLGGFGGGGNINFSSAAGGSADDDENDLSNEALQRAARMVALSEAEDMGLNGRTAVRFSQLLPDVRAALRDFNAEMPSAVISELALDSIDTMAKILMPTESAITAVLSLLRSARSNMAGDEWCGADLFKAFSTTQDIFAWQAPANQTAENLVAIFDALTLPPSSSQMIQLISRAMQSQDFAGKEIMLGKLPEAISGVAKHPNFDAHTLLYFVLIEGQSVAQALLQPIRSEARSGLQVDPVGAQRRISASQQANVPKILRDAAIMEGREMGFDPITSFQYACSELGFRPALRAFMVETPGVPFTALEIHALSDIAALISADGATADAMLTMLRNIRENTSGDEWNFPDIVKVLTTILEVMERLPETSRNQNVLLSIVDALTMPPAHPQALDSIIIALRRPELTAAVSITELREAVISQTGLRMDDEDASLNPAFISSRNPLLGSGFIAAPDAAMRVTIQYFLNETPDARFDIRGMKAIFEMAAVLPDHFAKGEVMLDILRKIRDNSNEEREWLAPYLLPIVFETARDLIAPLQLHQQPVNTQEHALSIIYDTFESLTGRRYVDPYF